MKRQRHQKLNCCIAVALAASLAANYAVYKDCREVRKDNAALLRKCASDTATIDILQDRLSVYSTTYVVPNTSPQRYLDVPLDEDLQEYIWTLCYNYDISEYYELIFAVIKTESNFNASEISATDDYGLMQINVINHSYLSEALGVNDFLDPYQNVKCGVYMLASLLHKYNNINRALMAYNMGENGATVLWNNGKTSTQYTEKVLTNYKEYI